MPGARLHRSAVWMLPAILALVHCEDDPRPVEASGKVPIEPSDGCGKASGAAKGVLTKQTIMVKGGARTYDITVGEGHDGKTPLPLVFVFHDKGGDGTAIRTAYDLAAEARGGAIFVYPDSLVDWELERDGEKNIDILMFDALRTALLVSHCVDQKRVFATGLGTGGSFANTLGCRRGSVLLAVASHAGTGPVADDVGRGGEVLCPEKPVAALIVHGADDATVELASGQRSRDHWTRVNGCKPGTGLTLDPSPCVELAGCAEHRPVRYCEVPGIGHTLWAAGGAKAAWSFFTSL